LESAGLSGGLEQPDVGGEASRLLHQVDAAFGVVDRRGDLAPVAHDAGIEQEPVDAARGESGDRVDIE